VLEDLDLVADLGAADDRRERMLGVLDAGRSFAMPTVEACARCAVPNASLTYTSQ
jgi:hypothetical protein